MGIFNSKEEDLQEEIERCHALGLEVGSQGKNPVLHAPYTLFDTDGNVKCRTTYWKAVEIGQSQPRRN